MVCGVPLSAGTGTASVSPESLSIRSVSISALMTKALPVCLWHSRQWQQWTNIGFDLSRYRTQPQAQPPSSSRIASSSHPGEPRFSRRAAYSFVFGAPDQERRVFGQEITLRDEAVSGFLERGEVGVLGWIALFRE